MGVLKDGRVSVILRGKERKMLLSLNALDAIQDRFGGFDKIDERLKPGSKEYLKDLRWLVMVLVNEGEVEDGKPPLTEEEAGRLMAAAEMAEVKDAIFATFSKGADDQEEYIEGNKKGEQVE